MMDSVICYWIAKEEKEKRKQAFNINYIDRLLICERCEVNPVHKANSIKQSPVLKGNLLSCPTLSFKFWRELNLLKEVICLITPFWLSQRWSLNTGLYKITLSLSCRWPLNTCLTVYLYYVPDYICLQIKHQTIITDRAVRNGKWRSRRANKIYSEM